MESARIWDAQSTPGRLLEFLAMEPNLSWRLQPWARLGDDKAMYLRRMMEYAVTQGLVWPLRLLSEESLLHKLFDRSQYLQSMANSGLSPLQFSVASKNLAVMSILLSVGCIDVDEFDTLGNTALMYAVQCGNNKAIPELIKRGADPLYGNNSGDTSIMIAVELEDSETTELLLQHYKDITGEIQLEKISRAIITAASRGHADILKQLLRPCKIELLDSHHTGSGKFGMLHTMLRAGEIRVAANLLSSGLEIYRRTSNGNTILHVAVGHEPALAHDFLQELLELKLADLRSLLRSRNNQGHTSLHLAMSRAKPSKDFQVVLRLTKIIQALDLTWTQPTKRTLLFRPDAMQDDESLLHDLVYLTPDEISIPVWTRMCKDRRAYAAFSDSLVSKGQNPLCYAAKRPSSDLLELMLGEAQYRGFVGRSGNPPDYDIPLHAAIKETNIKSVRLLLENGAIHFGLDDSAPIRLAQATGCTEIIDMIEQYPAEWRV